MTEDGPVPRVSPYVHRLAAFTGDPDGGNPAGVVVTEEPLTDADMQRIAAEVGYSETAFLSSPSGDRRRWQVRYFAPRAEVSFCGHATVASGVLLGAQVGAGRFTFDTTVGVVDVEVAVDGAQVLATLSSVAPTVEWLEASRLAPFLPALGYRADRLDPTYPPAIASAGARHLILVLRRRADLAALDYLFDELHAAMHAEQLTTVALLWPDPDGRWHARNPFPTGGVVEDPATGAAAAAFGAYLRELGHLDPPAWFEIVQGEDLGRPSRLHVHVPAGTGGIDVAGTAVPMPG